MSPVCRIFIESAEADSVEWLRCPFVDVDVTSRIIVDYAQTVRVLVIKKIIGLYFVKDSKCQRTTILHD